MSQFVKRAVARKQQIKGKKGIEDKEFAKRWPAIHEFVVLDTLDGAARETSTVTLSREGNVFKAALNDRDQEQSLFVSSDTLFAALDALEAALTSDMADWRPWKGGFKPKKK